MKPDGVVITGASTGIGAACARHLDELGFQVFAGVRKSQDGERLRAFTSRKLTLIRLDVTDDGSIAAAVDTVCSAVGESGLAGLVNNAGIAVPGPIETVPLAEARKQFEVNVLGQIAATQAFLPLLRQSRGRIVNMGFIAGLAATPFLGLYGASKFALEGLTDALRVEVSPRGSLCRSLSQGRLPHRFGRGRPQSAMPSRPPSIRMPERCILDQWRPCERWPRRPRSGRSVPRP